MKGWCRLCRKWVYDDHFLQSNGRRDGCGQGRDDIRYHPGHALVGDIWKMNGRFLVFDYVTGLCTGLTFEDGEARSHKYTGAIEDWLRKNEAALISTFEEWPMSSRWCDYRGWTPSSAEGPNPDWPKCSTDFIKFRVESLRRDGMNL